ncbi:EAL domain-containing response regulator [Modicisalibacter coralii]|uniref:EAL domain-containing response regulator n=1 Tax=Modicisalibacter coralii TaxID=2304602 RepID=UPI00100A3BB9|nr:EAL domain-containing response regulator [Halomonas coralii]
MSPLPLHAVDGVPPPQGAATRALIVDDDVEIRLLMRALLGRHGYCVKVASGLQELACQSEMLDTELIFLDVDLGPFTGRDVMQFLQDKRATAGVILVSSCSLATLEQLVEAGRSGGLRMLGYLHKPVQPATLQRLLEQRPLPPPPLTVAEFDTALRRDELFLNFQPKLELASGRLTGVEALLRWNAPGRGIVYPDAFIPLAEHSGRGIALTWHVLDLAFRQKARWEAAGHHFGLAVNVPPAWLHDADCLSGIDALAARHGIALDGVELEITESGAMECLSYARHVLGSLRDRGCTLSMDDFGTGYSSMAQLYRLPFDQIKVDRSFVGCSDIDAEAAAITRTIVDLGQRLGLRVVAEGIETPAQHELLTAMGCPLGQGYLFGRPMNPETFGDWLARHPRAPH